MATKTKLGTGVAKPKKAARALAAPVQLFGHVQLIQGYAYSYYTGIHALVALRDTPGKTVAVLTKQHRLQTLLETAAAAGRLIAFEGRLITGPTPIGSAFTVDAYSINGVTLYGSS